jgi:hypothetical protein
MFVSVFAISVLGFNRLASPVNEGGDDNDGGAHALSILMPIYQRKSFIFNFIADMA